jgi:hypothetical protein
MMPRLVCISGRSLRAGLKSLGQKGEVASKPPPTPAIVRALWEGKSAATTTIERRGP